MLKIKFLAFNAPNLLLDNIKTVEVDSVSAAWNHLQKVRDVNVEKYLTHALDKLEVKIEGLGPNDNMPSWIIFVVNKKGEVEFKDAKKYYNLN